MKISIENEEGQKVSFHAYDCFEVKAIKLSCECCGTEDSIILSKNQTEVLKQFLFSEDHKIHKRKLTETEKETEKFLNELDEEYNKTANSSHGPYKQVIDPDKEDKAQKALKDAKIISNEEYIRNKVDNLTQRHRGAEGGHDV